MLYALRLLNAGTHRTTHPAVRGLMNHPSPEVRVEAIRLLDESGDAGVVSPIEKMLHDPDLSVRTQALLYVAHHAQSIRSTASRSSASSKTSQSARRW